MAVDDDLELDFSEEETSEKITLEEARVAWQRARQLLCETKPNYNKEEKEELAEKLGIALSYLEDLEGTSGASMPESTKYELLSGVFKTDFEDFLSVKLDLFDRETGKPNDKMQSCLKASAENIRILFTFVKRTDRSGLVSLSVTEELGDRPKYFYRPAWEELQEKFAELTKHE